MINHTQIKWIKSVKHKKGTGWAYLNINEGDIFDLNFPAGKRYKTNAKRPQIGEIILLFQRVNKSLYEHPGLYLTHLVTPVSNKVEEGTDKEFPWIKKCEVIAIRKTDNLIPKPDNFYLKNRAWGGCHLISPSIQTKSLSTEQIQKQIWNLFFQETISDEEVIDDFVSDENENLSEKIKDALSKIPPELKKRVVYQSDRQDTPLIKALKKLYNYECQFPECKTQIIKKDGNIYIEIAHIIAVKSGGKSIVENLIPLCPNHHKEFDYGKLDDLIQTNKECSGVLNGKPFRFEFKS